MWQRIQTVYMALGALAFFSVGLGQPNQTEIIFGGLGCGLFIANIFWYKTRKRQFVVNRLVILVAFALEGLFMYPLLQNQTPTQTAWLTMAPLVAVLMAVLANRAIQRDEQLVKSADRLR